MKSLLLVIALFLNSHASIYKGQKEYVNNCVNCHIDGQSFIVTKTQKAWSELLAKKGSKLAQLHITKVNAEKSHIYFENKKYKKNSKYLKEFLVEYAKDSGKIPACN